jgi:hypothetical protein
VPGQHDGDSYFPEIDSYWQIKNKTNYEGFELVEYSK